MIKGDTITLEDDFMQNTNVLHIRMDSKLKNNVSKILESLGLTEFNAKTQDRAGKDEIKIYRVFSTN